MVPGLSLHRVGVTIYDYADDMIILNASMASGEILCRTDDSGACGCSQREASVTYAHPSYRCLAWEAAGGDDDDHDEDDDVDNDNDDKSNAATSDDYTCIHHTDISLMGGTWRRW